MSKKKKNPDKKVYGVEQKGFPMITHSIGAIQELVFLTTLSSVIGVLWWEKHIDIIN